MAPDKTTWWEVRGLASDSAAVGRGVPGPPGYSPAAGADDSMGASASKRKELDANYKLQKAMEFAQQPFKQIAMMSFMMWMSGSSVQIFSIMMVAGGVYQPIMAILGINKTFQRFEDARIQLTLPKLVFLAAQTLALGVAAWKLNSLGLLPTHASDWVSYRKPPIPLEISGGGVPLT